MSTASDQTLAIATLVHSDNDPRWLTKHPVPTAKADWRWHRKRHEERLQLQSVCAIAKWCQQADALRRLPALRGLAEVVLLHGGAHAAALIEAECSVRKTLVRVDPELAAAAGAFVPRAQTTLPRGESHAVNNEMAVAALHKWHAVSLVEFDFVLFCDLDADLLHLMQHAIGGGQPSPHVRLNAAWAFWMQQRHRMTASLVASPDHESPINSESRSQHARPPAPTVATG